MWREEQVMFNGESPENTLTVQNHDMLYVLSCTQDKTILNGIWKKPDRKNGL